MLNDRIPGDFFTGGGPVFMGGGLDRARLYFPDVLRDRKKGNLR